MPLRKLVADAFGVVTICLVALLLLVGLLCILYSLYLRARIRSEGFIQLNYFSGPWIIRIIFILYAILWGSGEVIRLSFLRREGRVLSGLDLKWQETVCKCYVVSSLGFVEPCLFLTLVFLLRAPLQNIRSGFLSSQWNAKTAGCVLLFCLPMFILQLIVILVGPQLNKRKSVVLDLPDYFTGTTVPITSEDYESALCAYPLLSTGLHGMFVIIITAYLFWLGRQILKMVINKGLQRRVYTLILTVSSVLPLRVIFLGLSVLSKPEHFLFEVLAFLAFLALLCCIVVCISMLVYYPVADSLAIGHLHDLEARQTICYNQNDTVSLIANESCPVESIVSPERNSDDSAKRGSISFRTLERGGASGGEFVELSLFSPSHDGSTPRSLSFLGWPIRHPTEGCEQ